MANTFLHALGTDVGASLCEVGDGRYAARAILAGRRRGGLRDRAAVRRRRGAGAGSGSACGNGAHRRGAGRCDDPRHRRGLGERALRAARGMPHAWSGTARSAPSRCRRSMRRRSRSAKAGGATHQGGIAAAPWQAAAIPSPRSPMPASLGISAISPPPVGRFSNGSRGRRSPEVAALGRLAPVGVALETPRRNPPLRQPSRPRHGR